MSRCHHLIGVSTTPEIMACDSLAASHRGIPRRDYLTIDDSLSLLTVDLKLCSSYPLEIISTGRSNFIKPIRIHKSTSPSIPVVTVAAYTFNPTNNRRRIRLAAFNGFPLFSFSFFFRDLPALHHTFKNAVPLKVTARCTLK